MGWWTGRRPNGSGSGSGVAAASRASLAACALLTAGTALLSACSTDSASSPLDAHPGQAADWSSTYSDLRNSSVSPAETPSGPRLRWSRDMGAVLSGPGTFTDLDEVVVGSLSSDGCNVYSLALVDGRKNWCLRAPTAGPRIASENNSWGDSYWPSLSGATAISGEGEYRWGTRPESAGTTARQLDGQLLLVVSNFGQARVFDTQHGTDRSGALDLAGDVPEVPEDYGLSWCETGTRGCPAPAPAAVSADGDRFYLTVWTPGEDAPDLVAVDVSTHARDDGDRSVSPSDPEALVGLTEAWRVPLAHGRTGAPVVLSADGSVAYVAGEDGLAAYSTGDGTERWFADTGVTTDFAPAVSADGTIVLGGTTGTFYRGPDEKTAAKATEAALRGSAVVELHDDGATASETWRAADAASLSAPVLSASGDVLLASRVGGGGVALRALGADGMEKWSVPVPDATGPVAGLTLDRQGVLVLALSVGRVYAFADA